MNRSRVWVRRVGNIERFRWYCVRMLRYTTKNVLKWQQYETGREDLGYKTTRWTTLLVRPFSCLE